MYKHETPLPGATQELKRTPHVIEFGLLAVEESGAVIRLIEDWDQGPRDLKIKTLDDWIRLLTEYRDAEVYAQAMEK